SISSHGVVVPRSALVDIPLLLLIVAVMLSMDTILAVLHTLPRWVKGVALVSALVLACALFISLESPPARLPAWVPLPALWWTVFAPARLLGGLASLIDLAAVPGRAPVTPRGLLDHLFLATAIVSLGAFVFWFLGRSFGLDTAVLVVLPVYFFYKWLVARDPQAVATATLLALASALSFWPANLGPRNIVAYLLVFEVAERLLERAHHVGVEYARLRMREANPGSARWSACFWKWVDWFFTLWLRELPPRALQAS